MSVSTFGGLLRSRGGRKKGESTPGVALMYMMISGDPTATAGSDEANARVGTSATEGEYAILPKGAIPMFGFGLGGATGGSSATVDIGLTIDGTNDPDGLLNEFDADTFGALIDKVDQAQASSAGASGIAADSQVTISVGSSAATGGTVSLILAYAMYDDGKENS